jgi:hypothetical protein
MSTLKVNTIQNASGVEVYTAKAWVNFNGTGTVAIRASGNVSSITDNGTGDYTVNFTTAMPDVNYAALASGAVNDTAGGSGVTGRDIVVNNNTTTSTRLFTSNSSGVGLDFLNTFVAIFR